MGLGQCVHMLIKVIINKPYYVYSQSSIKCLRKRWGLLGTRQQGYTVETVGDLITAAREIYPDRGAEMLRQYIEETKGVRIPRYENRFSENSKY